MEAGQEAQKIKRCLSRRLRPPRRKDNLVLAVVHDKLALAHEALFMVGDV